MRLKSLNLIFVILLMPFLLSAQIPDEKIPRFVGKYFKLNRLGPELISIDMFDHPELGRILKIKVIGRRSQDGSDLIFAFRAAVAVANLAQKNYDLLWVEMGINYKDLETVNAIAPVNCSIDAIILENSNLETWLGSCLQIL